MEKPTINHDAGGNTVSPSDRSRWIAALSYITFFCFIPLWKAGKDPFIRFHAKQGFLLFFAECVTIIVIVILEITIGKLRFIGLILVGLLQLVTGLGALTLSVLGFVKALFGEYWHLPFLGEYRDRIPHFINHEG
jgi:fumarate reductase subunit D